MTALAWMFLALAIVAALGWLREWRHCQTWRAGMIANEVEARKQHARTMAALKALSNSAANDVRFPG